MSGRYCIVDVSLCCGCYNCQIACKDEHVDNDWGPYAAPQPNIGQFWLKIREFSRGTLPKVKLHYVPTLCGHCASADCMRVCPDGAIYRREDGLVILDPRRCSGCGKCAEACPVGAIFRNEKLGIFQKCTGCAHLLDDGGQDPRCSAACHSGALRWMNEEPDGKEDKMESLCPPESGAIVFYKNIPRHFVAGTVCNKDDSDVLPGIRCTLTGIRYKEKLLTDGFGDFWFESVPAGEYLLEIWEKEGQTMYSERLSVKASLNLGRLCLDSKESSRDYAAP